MDRDVRFKERRGMAIASSREASCLWQVPNTMHGGIGEVR